MMKNPWLALAIGFLLLIGCSSISYAPKEEEARAKEFVRSPSMASIYVYRKASSDAGFIAFGMAYPYKLRGDTYFKPLSWVYPEMFLRFELKPGPHTMLAMSQRGPSIRFVEAPITVESDQIYFFELSDGPTLQRVPVIPARLALRNLRMTTTGDIPELRPDEPRGRLRAYDFKGTKIYAP